MPSGRTTGGKAVFLEIVEGELVEWPHDAAQQAETLKGCLWRSLLANTRQARLTTLCLSHHTIPGA